MFLYGEPMPVAHRARARVCSVRSEKSSFPRVSQISGQHFGRDALAQLRIFQRENDFHAFIEIALHPVGAAQINLRRAAVLEIIDTAVLQKASDDAAHPDAAAQSAHTGNQSALSTDDQVDLHAGLRSAVQRFDYRW